MPGVPWSAKNTMSRSPALTVAGIGTLCVVESVGNDEAVMDWTVGNPGFPPEVQLTCATAPPVAS